MRSFTRLALLALIVCAGVLLGMVALRKHRSRTFHTWLIYTHRDQPGLREALGKATRIVLLDKSHRPFPNPLADIKVDRTFRESLLRCISRKSHVDDGLECWFGIEIVVFSSSRPASIFGMAPDLIREPGPRFRARFWEAPGIRTVLGLPREWGRAWDSKGACPNLRLLIEQADRLAVTTTSDEYPPSQRQASRMLDAALKKRLLAALPGRAIISLNGAWWRDPSGRWTFAVMRQGKTTAEFVWQPVAKPTYASGMLRLDRKTGRYVRQRAAIRMYGASVPTVWVPNKTLPYGYCGWEVTPDFGRILQAAVAKAPIER